MSFFDLFHPLPSYHHPSYSPQPQPRSDHPNYADLRDDYPQEYQFYHPHPLHQLRRSQLERDALHNHHHPSSRTHSGFASPSHEDSLRAERARRLAEAKMRQQSRSNPETMVEITLPDGRHCIVPISWAKKMQAKYPSILTNSMIKPHHPIQQPPSPIHLDSPQTNDLDHDSDFFVLDPTQDPSIPVLSPSSDLSPAHHTRPTNPSPPQVPNRSPEDLDAAARLIQQQFRTYRSLKHLDELESKFQELKAGFDYPSPLDLTFLDPPNQHSDKEITSPTSTKLAFNNPVNRPVQAFEESLTILQIKADAVMSRGNPKIKNWRKRLIKDIESQLDQVDRFKIEAWMAQKRLLHSNSDPTPEGLKSDPIDRTESHSEPMLGIEVSKPDDERNDSSPEVTKGYGDEEMNDEIMNTDAESVSSDQPSVDSNVLTTSLYTPESSQRPFDQQGDLIIPIIGSDRPSLDNLVIPAPRSHDSIIKIPNTTNTTITPDGHPLPQFMKPPCIINPLVTNEGDLVCPVEHIETPHDILVSPV